MFRNLPALMSLTAALIVSVVTIIYRYNLTDALILILGAEFGFFIAGLCIRAMLNKVLVIEEAATSSEDEEQQEDTDNDDMK